jgi:hypothetical protein
MTQALKATEIDTLWIRNMSFVGVDAILKTMLSSDDSLIFVGYKKPAKIEVYNAINGDSITSLTFPRSESIMDDYDISKDGKYVMACENGDTSIIIHVWDMKSGNHLRTIFENDTNYTSFRRFDFLRITPDSRYIFTSMGGKQYRDYKGDLHDSSSRTFIIDTNGWQVQREISVIANGPLEHSPDNRFYAVPLLGYDKIPVIELRDINNDTLISKFVDSANVNAQYIFTLFKFSPDGDYLISRGRDDWYIWKIGQQNYYRKFTWNIKKSMIPLNFANDTGNIASQKYDTLTNKFKTILFDFINNTIIKNFDLSSDEILFTKINKKFIIRDFYSLFLVDSTWYASVFNNEKHHPDLLIMPNPASDFIEISVGTRRAVSETSDIKIFNIFGQTVLSVGAIHELPLRLDVSTFPPGMYFVRIGDKVGKFVKL